MKTPDKQTYVSVGDEASKEFQEWLIEQYNMLIEQTTRMQEALRQIDDIMELWECEGTHTKGSLEVWNIARTALECIEMDEEK
jgi:hypothetical protein